MPGGPAPQGPTIVRGSRKCWKGLRSCLCLGRCRAPLALEVQVPPQVGRRRHLHKGPERRAPVSPGIVFLRGIHGYWLWPCPRTLRSRCHRCCGAHGWRRFGDARELAQQVGALSQDLPDLILGEALEVGKALLHGPVKGPDTGTDTGADKGAPKGLQAPAEPNRLRTVITKTVV